MVEQRPFSDVRAVQVSAGPEAPAEARSWASWIDEYLARDGADDLRIVVGELVSNAVQHAGLAPETRSTSPPRSRTTGSPSPSATAAPASPPTPSAAARRAPRRQAEGGCTSSGGSQAGC